MAPEMALFSARPFIVLLGPFLSYCPDTLAPIPPLAVLGTVAVGLNKCLVNDEAVISRDEYRGSAGSSQKHLSSRVD